MIRSDTKLIGKLTTNKSSFTQSPASGITFAGSNNFSCNGIVATITITVVVPKGINTWTTIGTVPKAPKHVIYIGNALSTSEPNVRINSNGKIDARNNSSIEQTYSVSMSYAI